MASPSDAPVKACFSLRGSNDTFSQRQADIFGNLQALEEAHNKVYKDTKHERDIVKTLSWREPAPVVENLEMEKLSKEKPTVHINLPNSERDDDAASFRVPAPVGFSKRHTPKRAGAGRTSGQSRDPSKWTHYSLADVDEDAGTDRAVASELINELRRRRLEEEQHTFSEDGDRSHASSRILFRPTRGTKRTCPEVHHLSVQPPANQLFDCDDEVADVDVPSERLDDAAPNFSFCSRRRMQHAKHTKSRFFDEIADDAESEPVSEESEVSPRSISPTTDEDLEDISTLENAPEGL